MTTERHFRQILTRRVRAVVQASPEMRNEWQRRYWPAWFRRWMPLIVGAPIVAAGMVMMPLSVSFVMLLPYATEFFPGAREIPTPVRTWTIAHLTLMQAFAFLLALSKGNRLFCLRSELATRAYLPLHDHEHLRESLKGWLFKLAFCLWLFAPVYAAFMWLQASQWWQAVAIGVGALLQAWLCLSLAILFASSIVATFWRRATVAALALGSLIPTVGAAAGGFLPERTQQILATAVLVTPLGWVHGAIAFGVVEGHWWGWLFLVPVAAGCAYAAWWLRRGYAIGDIRISSTGEATPVFEYGLANDPSELLPGRSTRSTPAGDRADDAGDQSVRKKIFSGQALAPVDWNRLGFVERFVGQGLSDRQRTLIEFACGRRMAWTRGWVLFSGLAMLVASVLLLLRLIMPEIPQQEGFMTSLPLVFALPLIEAAAGMQTQDKSQRRGYALHPIGLPEFVAAATRMYRLRMILWIPVLLIVSLAIASLSRHFVATLFINLLIGIVVPRVWLGILFRGLLSEGSDFSWRRMLGVLLLAIPGTTTFLLIVNIHWAITAALVGLTALTGWLAMRYFDWLYLQGGMDLGIPSMPRSHRPFAL